MAIDTHWLIDMKVSQHWNIYNEMIQASQRVIAEALIGQNVSTGQMMALNEDGTVKPASIKTVSLDGGRTIGIAKPVNEHRSGDRVRVLRSGALNGKLAKLMLPLMNGAWSADVSGHSLNVLCRGDFEPLFKVGSRVACGHWTGVIIGPSTIGEQRWAIKRDDTCEEYQRKDRDLEPLCEPVPVSEPIITRPCDWCSTPSQEVHGISGVIGATGCNTQACRDLEKLYRDRLSAGGVDCPEERDAVRRFYKRQRGTIAPRVETAWDDHRQSTKWGGKREASLDQRIAAARAEQEVKRGPHDWDVFSGASYET